MENPLVEAFAWGNHLKIGDFPWQRLITGG
jgi:hypothetical protein